MVLYIGDKVFQSSNDEDLERFHEEVISNNPGPNLTELEEIKITESGELLFVHRNEMAVAKYTPEDIDETIPQYIGTSETIAQIVVILTTSRGFSIGHFDRHEGQVVRNFFDVSMATLSRRKGKESGSVDVHMFGGFINTNSVEIIHSLLTHMITSERQFRLRTYFCLNLNDQMINETTHAPIIRSVVFNLKTHVLHPALIDVKAWGPLVVLRNAALFAISEVPHLNSILDPLCHRLTFKPFLIHWEVMFELTTLLCGKRSELMEYSDTPEQESVIFYDLLRRTCVLVQFLLASGVDFFEEHDLEFEFDSTSRRWVPHNRQTEAANEHILTSFSNVEPCFPVNN